MVRAGLARGRDRRCRVLEDESPVPSRDLPPLQKRRRRENHVGVARRVRHHGIEDHREEILPLEPGPNPFLGRDRHQGVGVVDEQQVDRVRSGRGKGRAEAVHVHEAGCGLGRGGARRPVHIPPGRGIRKRVAAPPHAELPGHGRQGQDRGDRRASVAAALRAPSASQRRRGCVGVDGGETLDVLRTNAGLGGGSLRSPGVGAPLELGGAGRVGLQELSIRPAVGEEPADHGERDRKVRARVHGEMEVGALGDTRAPRIDDHEFRAPLLRFLDVRKQVDPRGRGIGAPEHDQVRSGVVRVCDARHLSVEAGVGGSPMAPRTPSGRAAKLPGGGKTARRSCPAKGSRWNRRRRTAGSPRHPARRGPLGAARPPSRGPPPRRPAGTSLRPCGRRGSPGGESAASPYMWRGYSRTLAQM